MEINIDFSTVYDEQAQVESTVRENVRVGMRLFAVDGSEVVTLLNDNFKSLEWCIMNDVEAHFTWHTHTLTSISRRHAIVAVGADAVLTAQCVRLVHSQQVPHC